METSATTANAVDRMQRLPATLGSTAVLVVVWLAVVGATVLRALALADTPRLRWFDPLLVVVLVLAVLAALVTADTRRGVRPRRVAPRVLQHPLTTLAETSVFGVGPLRHWTATNPDVGLDQVDLDPHHPDSPHPDVDHQHLDHQHLDRNGEQPAGRGAPGRGPAPSPDRPGTAGGSAYRPTSPGTVTGPGSPPVDHPGRRGPALGSTDLSDRDYPATPPPGRSGADDSIVADLVEHEVQRGQSWWTLAEERLDDGQRWDELRAVNLGREVAPGVLLDEQAILRPGWRVLVPRRLPTGPVKG